MKLKSIIVLILAAMPFISNAQQKKGIEYSSFFDSYYWRGPLSITGGIGLAMYNGDLCSDFSCTKPAGYYTLGLGYKLWPRVFVGAEVDYFGLNGTDEKEERGYEFTSKNVELAAYMNFYILEDIVKRHSDLNNKTMLVKPYLYLGVSGMRYKVTDNVGETTFPKYTALVPVGLGVLLDITPRINVKVDAIYKIGFSDYLDGASETANPDKNDAFGMARIKLVYTPKARRVKRKKIKVDPEEREKWNQIINSGGDSTKPKAVAPKEDVPSEEDAYYYEEEKTEEPEIEDSYYEESEGTKNEEETEDLEEEPTEESSEDDWDGGW